MFNKASLVDKPFDELSLDEFRAMRRSTKDRVPLNVFLEFYSVSIERYSNFVKNTSGVTLLKEEREAWVRNQDKKRRKQSLDKEELSEYSGVELKGFRMLRGYNTFEMGKKIFVFHEELPRYERRKRVPKWLADKYISELGITQSEIDRLRLYLARKTKGFEMERKIPDYVKKQVSKRDGNKCVRCKRDYKLHFHHKERFSKGGLHIEENIITLCAWCHAEEHKGEPSYWLLKKMAEEG